MKRKGNKGLGGKGDNEISKCRKYFELRIFSIPDLKAKVNKRKRSIVFLHTLVNIPE